jgi:hypothetical protein
MLAEETKSHEFLDRFVREILLYLRYKNQEIEKINEEEQRAKRAVTIEKLKIRFAGYQQATGSSFQQPQNQIQEKKEEKPNLVQITQQKPILVQPRIIPKPIAIQQIPIQPKPPKIQQNTNQPEKKILNIPKTEGEYGKITSLIKDRLVTYIECPKENKNIVIRKAGSTIRTSIILEKEEINKIIKTFSEKARIPVVEGMLNARVEDLEIASVLSDNLGYSFIIKRILFQMPQKTITSLDKPFTQFNEKLTPIQPRTFIKQRAL